MMIESLRHVASVAMCQPISTPQRLFSHQSVIKSWALEKGKFPAVMLWICGEQRLCPK
jgi:hypothetical protein